MDSFLIALVVIGCLGIIFATVRLAAYANKHPRKDYSVRDPETGTSEEDWMKSIR